MKKTTSQDKPRKVTKKQRSQQNKRTKKRSTQKPLKERLKEQLPWIYERLQDRLQREIQEIQATPDDPIFLLLEHDPRLIPNQSSEEEQLNAQQWDQKALNYQQHPGILKLQFLSKPETPETPEIKPNTILIQQLVQLPSLGKIGIVVSLQEIASAITRLQEGLVEETLHSLLDVIEKFVSPEYQELVATSRIVLNRFSWWDAHPSGALFISLAYHQNRVMWPPEAIPSEVLKWIHPKLRNMGLSTLAAQVLDQINKNKNVDWFSPKEKPNDHSRYSLSGIAHLYIAERYIRELGNPKAPSYAIFSVETPTVRTVTALNGAKIQKLHKNTKAVLQTPHDQTKPKRVVFKFSGGGELELPFDGGAAPLIAIARRYGAAAVRDLLAFYLFNWSARVNANEPIWWWPDEHLDVVGLSKDGTVRKSLMNRIECLTETHLTVYYPKGSPLSGPLIAKTGLTDTYAHQMMLHPALYRGVTGLEGRMERYWWPLPMKALQLPANPESSHVHILSIVVGHLWRAALPEIKENMPIVARIKAERLVQYLNIHTKDDRQHQLHATELLRRTLDKACEVDILGSWQCKGEFENLKGVLTLQAGEFATSLAKGEIQLERPSWIPSTSDDLRAFMEQKGWSATKTAKRIGVSPRSLQNVARYESGRPISLNIRKAFRRILWPGFEES